MQKNVLIESRVWTPWQTGKHNYQFSQQYVLMEDLAYAWMEVQQNTVKQSTYSNYYYHINNYILPYLGKYVVEDITEEEIISFISDMYEHLSSSTIQVILTTLKSILKFGCKYAKVNRDLLDCCRIHRYHNESKMLSPNESTRMKQYLIRKKDIFSVSILLCRSTGIRVGELCGLKWGDINFAEGTFQIRRTVSRITNPNRGEGQPKTILYIRSPKSHTSLHQKQRCIDSIL